MKQYRSSITTAFLLLLSGFLFGQTKDYRDLLRPNHITTYINQQKAVFTVKSYDKKALTDRIYHWYSTQKIHSTTGGYAGKVLDGPYTLYQHDNNLSEKGQFKNGLKTGVWKKWNNQGILEKENTWQKGIESGTYTLYNEVGHILEQGKLQEGKKQGKVKTFADDQMSISYFEKGSVIDKEQYTQQNIFRRSGKYIRVKWQKWFTKKDKPQD